MTGLVAITGLGAVTVFTGMLGNVAVLAVQLGVGEIVLTGELVDVHVVVVVLVAETGCARCRDWLCSLPRLLCQNSGGWVALGRV